MTLPITLRRRKGLLPASLEREPLVADPVAVPQAGADTRYRFERKFTADTVDAAILEPYIRLHPAAFRKIYEPRWINNIYFDTWNHDAFEDNIEGESRIRVKVRIRWYGELFGRAARPVLELKIKRGLVNRKESFVLDPLDIEPTLDLEAIHGRLRRADMPPSLLQDLLKLQPTLINRYHRVYYLAADRRFRLTMDSQLTFRGVQANRSSFPVHSREDQPIVIELKYPEQFDGDADVISQQLPLRLSRNSKYASGILRAFGELGLPSS